MQPITYTYTYEGLTIECHLEYDPPSPDDGFPNPEAFLIRAMVGGQDISNVMADSIIQRIEEAAAWYMLESRS